jgi:hypothetical protein
MDVKTTVKYKDKLVKLCKKHGITFPNDYGLLLESYGAIDLFMVIMEANVPHHVKYEALSYYDKCVVAALS